MAKTLSKKIGQDYVTKVRAIIGSKAGKKSKLAHTFLEGKDTPSEMLSAIAGINGYISEEVRDLDDKQAKELEAAFTAAVEQLKQQAKKDEQQRFNEYLAMMEGPVTVLPHGTTLYSYEQTNHRGEKMPPSYSLKFKGKGLGKGMQEGMRGSDAGDLAKKLRLEYGENAVVEMKIDGLDDHVLQHFGFRFDLKKIPFLGRNIEVDSKWRYCGLGYSMQQNVDRAQTAMLLEGLTPVPCVLSDWELRAIQAKLNDPAFIKARDAKRAANQPLSKREIDETLAPQSAVGQGERVSQNQSSDQENSDNSSDNSIGISIRPAEEGVALRFSTGPKK